MGIQVKDSRIYILARILNKIPGKISRQQTKTSKVNKVRGILFLVKSN